MGHIVLIDCLLLASWTPDFWCCADFMSILWCNGFPVITTTTTTHLTAWGVLLVWVSTHGFVVVCCFTAFAALHRRGCRWILDLSQSWHLGQLCCVYAPHLVWGSAAGFIQQDYMHLLIVKTLSPRSGAAAAQLCAGSCCFSLQHHALCVCVVACVRRRLCSTVVQQDVAEYHCCL